HFLRPQGDLLWFNGLRIRIHHPFSQSAAGSLQYQLRGAAACPIANGKVAAALKAVGGLRAQVKSLGSSPDVLRLEISALDQDVDCVQINLTILATHDSGQSNGFGLIGDQEHLVGKLAFLTIERHEALSFRGPPDYNGRTSALFLSGCC